MPSKTPDSAIYQLKVTLKHSKPPIWRRIQVRADVTLYDLHEIIQIAMGWTDSHLHQFMANDVYYGEPNPDFGFDVANERRVRLHQLVSEVKDKILYEYDFGDGWEHEIVLEKVLEPEPKERYPRCISGRRQCPPEDVGGIWGYYRFLEAIQQEAHPEHEEYLEWVDGFFDPESFHIDVVNAQL